LRRAIGVLGASAALAVAAAAVSPAAAPLRIASAPDLFPAFSPGVTDYVSRCGAPGRIDLTVDAPPGERVSVDGRAARGGRFVAGVTLGESRSLAVVATSAAGTRTYHVRCLPRAFPSWTATRTGPTQARWYLVGPIGHWAMFLDPRGVPVWWQRTRTKPFNPTLLRDNHVAWYPLGDDKFGTLPDKRYEEHRLDGTLARKVGTVGTPTDLHEIQELPNGHLLLDAYRPVDGVDVSRFGGPHSARVYFAEVQEVTRSGKLVWRWNARGRIRLAETGRWWRRLVATQRKFPRGSRWYDAMHVNSISPVGDDLVISCRHDDALYRIDRATGRVMWKLGGTHTSRSLEVVGDAYGKATFGGQHDVRVLPDGTVSVYDNGADRDRPPRVLRFRIDAKHRRATLIEQHTDPDVPRSGWGGGARRLPGGNWATAWGGTGYVTEMTAAGERVLQIRFGHASNYRVDPLPPGRLSAARLRAAMDRRYPRP
jgi:hypothetical protein